MNKEIFYLYRFKHKCPYGDPLIKTMLLVLCDCVCVTVLFVSIDCNIDACLLYCLFKDDGLRRDRESFPQND